MTVDDNWSELVLASDGLWDIVQPPELPQVNVQGFVLELFGLVIHHILEHVKKKGMMGLSSILQSDRIGCCFRLPGTSGSNFLS